MQKIKHCLCGLSGHNWTCSSEQGFKADPWQLESIEGFHDYAKMYCKDCGHESTLNKK